MEKISNETAGKLIAWQDAVWQLGNTLRDMMHRMETIQEHNKIDLESEIKQCRHTLERYSKGALFYKPHPYKMDYDSVTKKDQLAIFPPTKDEIRIQVSVKTVWEE